MLFVFTFGLEIGITYKCRIYFAVVNDNGFAVIHSESLLNLQNYYALNKSENDYQMR